MVRRGSIRILVASGVACATLVCAGPAFSADDHPSITPADLAMKDNAAEPGAPAMILYREDVVHNKDPHNMYEEHFRRLKIFTDEGKSYSDVEIPFLNRVIDITNVHGRTIHPDGKTVEFDGKTFNKLIAKFGDVKIQYKTFTLPDATPGSILEYQYRVQIPSYYYGADFEVQGSLYTRQAHFIFEPYGGLTTAVLLWRASHIGEVKPVKQSDKSWALDVNGIPGLPDEPYMLPTRELRGHVEFFYTYEKHPPDSDLYWNQLAKAWADEEEKLIGKRGEIVNAANGAIGQNDPPEARLQKLYARAQQIHNLNDDPAKTVQEEGRDKTKESNNVGDTLKHGYGYKRDVNRFFVALTQAAGFEASLVWVTPRNVAVFHPEGQNSSSLSDTLVWVRSGDTEYYLDPGVSVCPFGLIPWYETGVAAMRPTKQGAVFRRTPLPSSSSSVIDRRAQLSLASDGLLSGNLTVRFTGERALIRRMEALQQDELGREKIITDEIKSWLPSGAKFDLTSYTGWEKTDVPLEVQGKIELPGVVETTARRLLLPLGVYEAPLQKIFVPADRRQDVYFSFPYEAWDDITIQLPEGWRADKLPAPQVREPGDKLSYQITAKLEGSAIHIQSKLIVGSIHYPVESYSNLRGFFSTAKADDEQQIVLQASASSGGN